MVNVERVKNQCQIAFYEQRDEKKNRGIGMYYRSDFVGKEVIKSIFTGTITYLVMVALWAMAHVDFVLKSINDLSIIYLGVVILVIYVVFLVIYLLATHIIYTMRYVEERKQLDVYKGYLKALNQMYEREEKLKL